MRAEWWRITAMTLPIPLCTSRHLLLAVIVLLPSALCFSADPICHFPDAPELGLASGRVPLFDEGLLSVQPPVNIKVLDGEQSFTSYLQLKATVEDAFASSSSLEDPVLRAYHKAIQMVEQHGAALETLVERHPGYGMENLLRQVVGTAPSSADYDISLRYIREGTVDIPKARMFDPSFNCTAGFSLMNASLVDDESGKVVYTSPEYDYEGGHDAEKCPLFDDALGCYVDPTYEVHTEGECCNISSHTQRAIVIGQDQYYPGTCEADIICSDSNITDAMPCGDGKVCDENTAGDGATRYPCAPGYVCGLGTTPDASLTSPSGQFGNLCSEGYQCEAGTGTEERDSPCPPNFFCPAGTAVASLGLMANDALSRGLDLSSHGNPHLLVSVNGSLAGKDENESICLGSADDAEYLSRFFDRDSDGTIDPPEVSDPNVTNLDGAARPEIVNMADELAMQCERDHQSRFIAEAIRRQECHCTEQLFVLAALYRLWQCTTLLPLTDFGIGALQEPILGRGHRDFWFDRIHRDYDLALGMDKAMEGYGLKWGDGAVCSWPDDADLSLVRGKIPGFDDGLLSIAPEKNVALKLRFTWLEDRSFGTYEELKEAVSVEYAEQLNLTASNDEEDVSIDPFVYDLHHSVQLIEQFGAKLESLVSFREARAEERFIPWGQSRHLYNFSSTQLTPGRLDVCSCQDLLKCPNGTHFRGSGAVSIYDCQTNGNEILRRVSLLPQDQAEGSARVKNNTDYSEIGGGHKSNAIATFKLEALETAIFNLDLTGLPINMTYQDHYRVAVYVDCKPCPPRYRCEQSTKTESSCSSPTQVQQEDNLSDCLKQNRRQVCVRVDGSDADVEWCKEQTIRFDNETNISEERAAFESKYLLYTEPDLHKCLSMPFFCDNTSWNYRTFRRLCQRTLPDGSIGPPYDCSLVDRWEEYEQWANALCCSTDPSFQGIEACIDDVCKTNDDQVHSILQEKFGDAFRQAYGFDPPQAAPQGSLIMDAVLQEARGHPAPLELFNEWKDGPLPLGSDDNLKPHNVNYAAESTPWLEKTGCCQCQPHPLPSYFASAVKHQHVQFTISALSSVELTVVVELLHGQYYPDFDEYFSTYDKSWVRVHTPGRADNTVERASWMAILDKDVVDAVPLELPLNLPMTWVGGKKSFENRILIDRPSALEIGRLDLFSGDELATLAALDSSKNETVDAENDGDRRLKSPYPVLDNPLDLQERPQWWEKGDETALAQGVPREMSFIALPYLPFFSNCEGYDSHISISRLLEENPGCTIVPYEETRVGSQYRLFNRAPPISDYCQDVDLQCSYEEDLVAPRERYRWYESGKDDVLFHLTSNAIEARVFEAQRNDAGLVESRWGRGLEIDMRRDSYKLVPVTVDSTKESMKNVIPRLVELELEYYQKNEGQKRIVDASIRMVGLCTTIKPKNFGGNADLLASMAARGIGPCECDIDGEIMDVGYTLRVNFHALTWHRLLNRFQFNEFVYLMLYTIVGAIAVALAAILWGGSRLMTKLRYPPKLHCLQTLRLVARPALSGVSLAIIPVIVCLSTIHLPANLLRGVDGTWMRSTFLDKARIESNYTGRTGTAILIIGLYLSIVGAKILIPNFQRKHFGEKARSAGLNDGSGEGDGDGDGDSAATQDECWTPAIWRRSHLLWTSMCLQFVLLTIMEYSFSSSWEVHVFLLIVVFKLLQIVLELVLGAVLKEALIMAPLLVVAEICSVMVTMGAADFTDFILSHYIALALIVAKRLFINPTIKRIKTLIPRWKIMLVRRFTRFRKISDEEKQRQERTWEEANEFIELQCEGVEPLLDSLGVYSIESTGMLLAPLVFSFLVALYEKTDVATKYGVEKNELQYYLLFVFFMIPWGLVFDVLLVNAMELIHGWKIHDYLSYQHYRFANRKYRWMLNSLNVDESISESLQTMDLMCFSSQYYFLASIFAMGAMLTMLAVTVFTRSQFNFLGDPATPVVVLSMCLVCEGTRRGTTYASTTTIGYFEWRGLWGTKQLEGTMDDAVAARLAVGIGNQAGLEQERLELQALNSDRFRTRFMERNRPWVLQHLVDLIPAEVIQSMPSDSIEQLRGIHADLNNFGKGLRRPGDRPDISSDTDEDENEREHRRQWNRAPLRGQQVQLARSWVRRAKKNIFLSRVVQGTIENSRASSCSFCGRKSHQCNSLAVSLAKDGDRDAYALDGLIRSFEDKYGENEENLDLWKAFFRTNASFVTTCDMCMGSGSAARVIPREEVTVARAVDISSDEDSGSEEDREPFDAVVSVDQTSRDAMAIWLNAARARLGEEEASSAANKTSMVAMEPSQHQIMANWLNESRRSKANRDAERGAEIRRTVGDTAARHRLLALEEEEMSR